MMNENPCELIETKTAEEFMEALNPLNVPKHLRGNIIYRGQRDARWELIPSLFRGKKDGINKEWNFVDISTYEASILKVFIDRIGKINLTDHRVVDASKEINAIFQEHKAVNIELKTLIMQEKRTVDEIKRLHTIAPNCSIWPDIAALEMMALAQHSGLPTRLLDWTTSPYVAAHFAAFSLIGQEIQNDQKIAVWSLNKRSIPDIRSTNIRGEYPSIYRLGPPFWGNITNAISQSGCFLFIKNSRNIKEFKEIDISEYLMKYQPFNGQTLAFKKVTLPARQFENVLEMCDLFGVSESKLFRTYEGCAADTKVRMPAIKTEINKIRAGIFKCPT